jgi:hypothetical protein
MDNNFKFNLLIDELPSTVIIDGSSFSIRSDFRTGILVNQCLNDDNLNINSKVLQVISLGYVDDVPENLEDAFNALIKFYSGSEICNNNVVEASNDKKENTDSEYEDDEEQEDYDSGYQLKVFDYDYDQVQIFNSFMSKYNINLCRCDLHWYEFYALLLGLFDENDLTKVLQYRTMKIDSKLPKEQRKYYSKMKQHYKIKDNEELLAKKKEQNKKLLDEWG